MAVPRVQRIHEGGVPLVGAHRVQWQRGEPIEGGHLLRRLTWSAEKADVLAAPAASCELDASSPDTDGDFVLDHEELAGWEVIIRSVIPVDPDDEEAESGLAAVSQGAIASLPWYADSDLDGVEDGVEKRHAANPASADSDGDGFTDSEEIDTGGITTRESDPPSVEVEKRGDGFVIRLYCTGKWSFCLDPVLERVFKVRLKVTDNAGVADTRVWLGEAGMRDDGPGTSRAPGRAVDPLAALIHTHRSGGSPLDASTASALDKGTLGIKAGGVRDVHNGLPTDVWIDLDVSRKLRLDFTKLSTARSVLNGDLFDMFGEFTMYIEAADVAGNIGQGEVTFDSALNLLLTYLNSAINALADFLDAIIDAVKQLAMLYVDFVIKPLINMYLSAATLLYPFIEYFVSILEAIAYLDLGAFWNHEFTQEMFGAVLGLLRQWNLITFTIDVDTIIDWVASSVQGVIDSVLGALPTDGFGFVASLSDMLSFSFDAAFLDNLWGALRGDVSTLPSMMVMMALVVVRVIAVLPKLVPGPGALVSAFVGAAIGAVTSTVVPTILGPLLDSADNALGGALTRGRVDAEAADEVEVSTPASDVNIFMDVAVAFGVGGMIGIALGLGLVLVEPDPSPSWLTLVIVIMLAMLSLAFGGIVLGSYTCAASTQTFENSYLEANLQSIGKSFLTLESVIIVVAVIAFLGSLFMGGESLDSGDIAESLLMIIGVALLAFGFRAWLAGDDVAAFLITQFAWIALVAAITKVTFDTDEEPLWLTLLIYLELVLSIALLFVESIDLHTVPEGASSNSDLNVCGLV